MSDFDAGIDNGVMYFTFPAPTRPLSENESRRLHWATRKQRIKPWKEATLDGWYRLKLIPGVKERIGEPGTVLVHLPFQRSDAQWASDRRDPHNYVGTMCKAIVDQLTDHKTGSKAKGTSQTETRLWPDDTTEFVEVLEPKLIRGTVCTVQIFPRF